jgi:hypothetical protein
VEYDGDLSSDKEAGMAFDEGLAARIRDVLRETPGVEEKKMFGGICFTLGGHMMVGVVRDSLMARVGGDAEPKALRRKSARPMDFTGRPMKGYVFVDGPGIAERRDLEAWIAMARSFVELLPPKGEKRPKTAPWNSRGKRAP